LTELYPGDGGKKQRLFRIRLAGELRFIGAISVKVADIGIINQAVQSRFKLKDSCAEMANYSPILGLISGEKEHFIAGNRPDTALLGFLIEGQGGS